MSVTYRWTTLSDNFPANIVSSERAIGSITFSDSAVGTGSYATTQTCLPCASSGDDPAQMQVHLVNTSPLLSEHVSLTFNLDGTLSGIISYHDQGAFLDVQGDGALWSGKINADWLLTCPIGGCSVTGYYFGPATANIPEPASAAIFAGSLMLATLLRRRRGQ
jgi:hypothetical protein